jgi:ribosomal-protein-alanine N-acetyltransferase
MAESVFGAFDTGYGDAVARWVLSQGAMGWVAEEDGKPLGFSLVQSLGVPTAGGAHVTELSALAVDPAARRRGVGRALLATALRNARATPGFIEMILLVAERNAPARALFLQAGFEDLGPDGSYEHGDPARRMRWRPRSAR